MAVVDVVRRMPDLPNCWGEGALFAFSGMDGPTESRTDFVATLAEAPGSWLIHTPRRRVVAIDPSPNGEVIVATGDVVWIMSEAEEAGAVFTAWHTVVGIAPRSSRLLLRFEDVPAGHEGETQVTVDKVRGDVVVLERSADRWAVAYGTTVEEALVRARQGLAVNLAEIVIQRLAIYQHLPSLSNPRYLRLRNKCVSVMRVNTLAPEGCMRQHWSTPDRVPHRHMWLWDSVFHSFGMNFIDPMLSWEFLEAVLERQRDDGMIPHCMHVDGTRSEITQPPVLAWGVWENFQHHGDMARLACALPKLEANLTWNLAHRDFNGNGLLAWHIAATPTSRSGESGMDNSPRFDRALALDAVDFSTFQALDMAATANIAETLGDHETAAQWRARAAQTAQQIHAHLWHPNEGFYFDRELDGAWSPVKAVSGFLPLLLDSVPAGHVDALVAHLRDPSAFWTAFPVPSVAMDHPAWSTDMWRGATWVNFDDLIYRGLLQHGYHDLANELKGRLLAHVERYYATYGVLFEFYDAKDEVPPVACDRKGRRREPYDIRVKMDSIRDYHWTAALVLRMLLDR